MVASPQRDRGQLLSGHLDDAAFRASWAGRRKENSAVLGASNVKYRVIPWRPAVLLAFSALLVGIPASASAAPAAPSSGFVALGNLSETPSPVDVYLYSSGDSSRSEEHTS